MQGLLLFAHGARDPQWARPFDDIRQRIQRQSPQLPVVLAYLEFMSPHLLSAGAELVREGCTQVKVLPLFLGAGGHVRKDLPQLLAQLAEQHPDTEWQLCPAIGEVDSVVQAMAQAALNITTPAQTINACTDGPT